MLNLLINVVLIFVNDVVIVLKSDVAVENIFYNGEMATRL